MREMQYTGMVMMGALTLTLVFIVLRRGAKGDVLNRSGWLMAFGTALLTLQFAVQYVTRFRPTGELTKSAMINLLLFIPSVVILNMGMLNLQRQGRLRRIEWLVGLVAWAVSTVLLLGANPSADMPLMAETERLRMAEYIVTFIFGATQIYYTYLFIIGHIRTKRALADYYDRDMSSLLRWIELSIVVLALIGVTAPPFVFHSGRFLQVYMLLIFFGVYYMILSFVCYSVSSDAQTVTVAEEAAWDDTAGEQAAAEATPSAAEKKDGRLPHLVRQRVEHAAAQWLAERGHLRQELNAQTVANELHVPRPHLTAWLRESGYESFSTWLATLRIDEAKRLLLAHPEWNNEFIALNCGFSDRSYFQKVFRKYTGMTPAQFVNQASQKDSAEP